MCAHLIIFHVDVACNTNASDVCEIKFTYLLTYVQTDKHIHIDRQTAFERLLYKLSQLSQTLGLYSSFSLSGICTRLE